MSTIAMDFRLAVEKILFAFEVVLRTVLLLELRDRVHNACSDNCTEDALSHCYLLYLDQSDTKKLTVVYAQLF